MIPPDAKSLDGCKTPLDIGVFYHVYPGKGWEEMYQEQLGCLVANGLYDKIKHLHIGFNGNLSVCSVPDKAVAISNENKSEETETLIALRDWCAVNPDAFVLYFHTKGVSRQNRFTEDWRKCMQYFVITNWRECYKALQEGYDLAGINWQEDTSMGYRPHFSGNFWWAKASYINTLSEEALNSTFRYDREFWIGTGKPKVKNLWETRYNNKLIAHHYREPYPKTIYTKNYMTAQEHMDLPHWHEPDKEIIELLDQLNINGFEYSGGTDKATTHNYTGIYADLLAQYRKKEGTLLEIGVQHGGSSLLWHEYLAGFKLFLSDIQDIVPDLIWDQMDPDRYDFYEGDAYNRSSVEMFSNECPEGFDIIIDDGPHTLKSQVFVVEHYYPLLKPGGALVIEDIQDMKYLEVLTETVPEKERNNVRIFDNRPSSGRYDDVIWAIFATER